jgi:glycerol-3-phosphate dehydrogenase
LVDKHIQIDSFAAPERRSKVFGQPVFCPTWPNNSVKPGTTTMNAILQTPAIAKGHDRDAADAGVASPFPPLDRSRFVDEIRANPDFDVLVVGGGIAGVAILRELSLQGLRAILVERADFASGASGALTRVAQGGFRYLEKGELGLVSRAVRERNRFVAAAPHQVRPVRVVLPSESLFGGAWVALSRFLRLTQGHSLPGALIVRSAVALYQFLGRRTRILPDGGFFSVRQLRQRYPGIARRLRGAAFEFEALIASPERVAIELAEDAVLAGAGSIALNRARISAIETSGVQLVDDVGGETFTIHPRIVVNAGGANANAVARLFGIDVRLVDGVAGTHLLLRVPALARALGEDLLFFEDDNADRSQRRLCCTYAIGDDVLLGATEVPTDDPDTSKSNTAEEDYLIRAIRHLFPGIAVDAGAIVGRLHGVRPLVAVDGNDVTGRSRDHAIRIHHSPLAGVPLVSIAGGKWTTFRAIAADATDTVLSQLGRRRIVSTETVAIGGGRDFPTGGKRLGAVHADLKTAFGIDGELAKRLVATYGSRAARVAAYLRGDEDRRRIAGSALTFGEVRFFAYEEMAITSEDVTHRRTRLFLTGAASAKAEAEIGTLLTANSTNDCASRLERNSDLQSIDF